MSRMKLLMIDNYDSFTYNIVQYFGELGAEVEVFRNDEITVADIAAKLDAGQLDRLVVSPGPCSPVEAGISVAAIQHFAGKLPILGVCLGHQAIGAAFGGHIIRAQQLMHGKTSVITTTQQGVFAGRGRNFRRGDSALCRQAADSGYLPGAPSHRRSFWRQDHPGAGTDAWQDQRHHNRAAGCFFRPAQAIHRQPLPLAGN